MNRTVKCILTFPSLYDVLDAERILQAKGLSVRPMPVPRIISSDCGVGLEYACDDEPALREILAAAGRTPAGYHRYED